MNDWWSFDPEGKSWRRLRATGDAPTPRRDHWGAVERWSGGWGLRRLARQHRSGEGAREVLPGC